MPIKKSRYFKNLKNLESTVYFRVIYKKLKNGPFLQGDIRYQVTGNYPAPTFFDVNAVTGMIFLTRSVALDGLLSNTYFVKLIAYDTVYPNIQATATATINVNRNPNPPIFNPSTYRVTLSENHALGSAVVDVNATDADFVCIPFFLQKALRFEIFSISYNVLILMDHC